jgi:hypothetical protein
MSEPVPPEAAVPVKKPSYVTLWFDEQGNLECKAEGLNIYSVLGVLRAGALKFEKLLSGSAPSSAPDKKDTGV